MAAVAEQRDALALKVAQAAGAIHAAEELKESRCDPRCRRRAHPLFPR